MSKKQLAMAYAPELTVQGARNRLHSWLRYNKQLMQALYEANYTDSQRLLTVRQVSIIFEYLGQP